MRFLKGLFGFFFIVFVGCADNNNPTVDTQTQVCTELAIPNQWVVKSRQDPRPHLVVGSFSSQLSRVIHSSDVEWYEPNYRFLRRPVVHDNVVAPIEFEDDSYLSAIQIKYAWNKGYFGQGMTVAVIDSGVDINHPRLHANLMTNPIEAAGSADNKMDDDGNGFVDDIYGWNFVAKSNTVLDESGHGTHIAGIIAATHDSLLARGLAPLAQILPVDFVDGENGDEFSAYEAINYALSRNVNIINNSWSSLCSQFLRQAFEGWSEQNVIFVSSAGNNGKNLTDYPLYPASLSFGNHITVGSMNRLGHRASFSNFGPSVTVLAPGESILGITPSTSAEPLTVRDGTSLSAAFVSGTLAVGWATRPELTAHEVVSVFKATHSPRAGVEDPQLLNVHDFLTHLTEYKN